MRTFRSHMRGEMLLARVSRMDRVDWDAEGQSCFGAFFGLLLCLKAVSSCRINVLIRAFVLSSFKRQC